MTKAKMLGGVLGAMLALTGCAGGATSSADPAQLDVTTVSSAIDGRTDLFLDHVLSTHLLTADEVNGSPTATAVEVQVTESELIAWRAQPGVPAAERSRTDADIVGRFEIVGTTDSVDLSTAETIGNETHPGGDGSTVVLPGGVMGHFRGGVTGSSSTLPRLNTVPAPIGLNINWNTGGIPTNGDQHLLTDIAHAHPGCAG